MVIKVYISGISGNKEVKKRQQRVLLILDSKNVKYEVIDMAEPGAEEAKDFMQNNSTSFGGTIGDPTPRHPLPPQIFNDEVYCGDYDMFDMANELDEMEKFLKLEPNSLNEQISSAEINLKNGDASIDEKIDNVLGKTDESKENEVPNEQKYVEDNKEDGSGDREEILENGGLGVEEKVEETTDKEDTLEQDGTENKTIVTTDKEDIEKVGAVESEIKDNSDQKEDPVDKDDVDSGAGDEAEEDELENVTSLEKSDE
ncbi:SH3 domain-binding glutamic acid-rich protein homolog isoform X1 [Diorhabda sublineata]|uniref:SH3 domain-binding glutamic acid-rich protein homolog isoform X1 n=1 Tax=Diorhabda sublineata TaxID=1163346 RepID=UPI0024E1408B|nr:SH3 domain-binding glutamic acid-rich protein homolog isoform X1 [Diorhabda sublineata]